MVRPTKLNDELTDLICENIELGLSYNLACQGAGITFETFNQWMKKGDAVDDDPHTDFSIKVHAAEAACTKNCLMRIREAADHGTWTASAWLMERRYRNDYGKNERIDLKNEHSGAVKIVEFRTEDCGSDD
jgi:transposase